MHVSATPTKSAAAATMPAFCASPSAATPAMPNTADRTAKTQTPRVVASCRATPPTTTRASSRKQSSQSSNGVPPGPVSCPNKGEGETATKNSHAQKNPNPSMRTENSLLVRSMLTPHVSKCLSLCDAPTFHRRRNKYKPLTGFMRTFSLYVRQGTPLTRRFAKIDVLVDPFDGGFDASPIPPGRRDA